MHMITGTLLEPYQNRLETSRSSYASWASAEKPHVDPLDSHFDGLVTSTTDYLVGNEIHTVNLIGVTR